MKSFRMGFKKESAAPSFAEATEGKAKKNLQYMYTCPMHGKVRQEKPGRCPKCGMALVLEGSATMVETNDRGLGVLTWKNYLPLIAIIALIFVFSDILSYFDYRAGQFSTARAVSHFMAVFFIVFAFFKLLDIKGFAEGYATYDLIAQKIPAYGYVYPFIELGFGLLMLAGIENATLLWSEVAVMGVSGLGVVKKMLEREPVRCVCLGTILKVPLTNITLIEDFGMVLLALTLIFLQ